MNPDEFKDMEPGGGWTQSKRYYTADGMFVTTTRMPANFDNLPVPFELGRVWRSMITLPMPPLDRQKLAPNATDAVPVLEFVLVKVFIPKKPRGTRPVNAWKPTNEFTRRFMEAKA